MSLSIREGRERKKGEREERIEVGGIAYKGI